MNDQFLRKKFIFNENIDANFLFSMYEDDFLYIEEIFKTTLDQLNSVVLEIPEAFGKGDLTNLKKIVHKIKPAFGFTGFLETEQACQQFENACTGANKIDDLTIFYHPLSKLLSESMQIMKKEHAQLKEFNSK